MNIKQRITKIENLINTDKTEGARQLALLECEMGIIEEAEIEAKTAEYVCQGVTLRRILDEISKSDWRPEHLRNVKYTHS